MTRDEDVLVSSSDRTRERGPKRYHRRLGDTEFSVCSRLEPQHDSILVSRDDAEDDGLKPCSLCRFPEESERRVVADGGK